MLAALLDTVDTDKQELKLRALYDMLIRRIRRVEVGLVTTKDQDRNQTELVRLVLAESAVSPFEAPDKIQNSGSDQIY